MQNTAHILALANGDRLDFTDRPAIMAIVNVTPDSFSDGGRYNTVEAAVARAGECLAEGAGILDVGGESTRPGHEPVTVEEELRRVVPAVKAIHEAFPQAVISVDTSKAPVARGALAAGAQIVNDVTALEHDGKEMAEALRDFHAPCILMNSVPIPPEKPFLQGLLEYLRKRLDWCCQASGLSAEHFALDPGIGFAKDLDQNLACIAGLRELSQLRRPMLIGPSRKSFLGLLTERQVGDRLAATVASVAVSAFEHADILRVHDVSAGVDAVRVATALAHSRSRL
ncbi:MAG: dihydropteroate synthase [Victivallales bacterium]|nr:dihydropteroate synthase [Victivallales bacterium]